MNNSYLSSSMNDYSASYNYSFQYASPSTQTYFYSPSLSGCPIHSPQNFNTSTPSSMSITSLPYTYYHQPQTQVDSSSIQQRNNLHSTIDRTPLRRHQCFKKNELQILHQAYMHDPHPSTNILQQLALQLQTSIDKVRQWFKNRRHSDKLKKRETGMIQTSTTN